jgi:ParB family chromosome partitioning protein
MANAEAMGRLLVPDVEPMTLQVSDLYAAGRLMRFDYPAAAVEAMRDSLVSKGQLVPLIVRPRAEGGFEVLDGETRRRAMLLGRIATAKCLVVQGELTPLQLQMLKLTVNCQRNDMSPVEVATQVAEVKQLGGMDNRQVAALMDKSEGEISRLLELLQNPDPIRRMIAAGTVPAKAGYYLARLRDDPERQRQLAEEVAARRLSCDSLARLVGKRRAEGKGQRGKKAAVYLPAGGKLTVEGIRGLEQLAEQLAQLVPDMRKHAQQGIDLETYARISRDRNGRK